MKMKSISITVIVVLFLSLISAYWDFELRAINLDNEPNSIQASKFNTNPRTATYDWGEIEVISEPIVGENINIGFSESPKVAIENGKIYVVWYDFDNTNGAGTDWDIFYRYFDGNKWSKIQVISEPIEGLNHNTGDSAYPDIAVENGKIYVVWSDYNNTNNAGGDVDIFYRCNITGYNWEPVQVISEPMQNNNLNIGRSVQPSIAVENGKIYVVWRDDNDTKGAGTDDDIFYRCNLTGTKWEDIQIISEPVQGKDFNNLFSESPDITVENGRIYIVWQDGNNTNNAGEDLDIFYRCNLTGYSWEDIQVISEPFPNNNINIEASYNPVIAVENDRIYIVWCDENNTYEAGEDLDIFYRCNLTGYSWESVQVISEPVPRCDNNVGDSISPDIAVENSKIYVVWHDFTNISHNGLDGEIFYRCNISGSNWEDIKIISEPIPGKDLNVAFSGFPDIAVNLGKNYIVWQDSNDTNGAGHDPDIFYRYIFSPLFLNFSSVSPISGYTNTNFYFTVTYFHLNNMAPTGITVDIDGTVHSMLEADLADNNYIDGKDYFFNIKNLDIGDHTYQFYASDGNFTKFTALVNRPKVYNTPPNITTEDIITAIEDVYYEMNYEYEDIDNINVGQSGFWNIFTNASWLEFNHTTAVLNGTPTNNDVGEYWVNITINDGMDLDFSNFTLTAINVNDPPFIVTNNTEIIYEDNYYQVEYKAIDIDTPQKRLIWTINTNATWLNFDLKTTILNGTPENDDVGQYWVNISVNDTLDIDFTNFTLTVVNVNDPPEIITKDVTTINEDEYYEMDYKAVDVDNSINDLIWNIRTNANWLKYDLSSSIINGTPTNDDVGEYWVYILVSDAEYTDFTNFTLIVKNINDPPVIITKNVKKVKVGETYSVNYEVIDIDPTNDKITWSLSTNVGDWLTIDSITGLLIGEPSKNDIGKYWVNVTVNDNNGGIDYHNFTLTVESSEGSILQETTLWYWLILIIVAILIIFLLFVMIHKKRKAEKIPVVRAELMKAAPKHLALPGEISSSKIPEPLAPQPKILEQLPAPRTQVQPLKTANGKTAPIPTPTKTPVQPQYQLPQITLSKSQKLGLLQERFLRGEITEETYNKLKVEIEGNLEENSD